MIRRTKPISKRVFDLAGAALGLGIFAIPMSIIGVAVRITMGRPMLFRQRRPGLGGRLFTLYKFRTMSNADSVTPVADDARRIEPLGRFLRALSLDELPELFNVLKGDMSLVGPRPLLPQYLDLYTSEQARRHEVRPGITGWAQINGRNALTWEQKFQLDVWYVDHWSLGLDLRIFWMTFAQILKRQGVSAEGHATMPEFTGTQTDEDRS